MKISIPTYDTYESESGSLAISHYNDLNSDRNNYWINIKGKNDLDIYLKVRKEDLQALVKAISF